MDWRSWSMEFRFCAQLCLLLLLALFLMLPFSTSGGGGGDVVILRRNASALSAGPLLSAITAPSASSSASPLSSPSETATFLSLSASLSPSMSASAAGAASPSPTASSSPSVTASVAESASFSAAPSVGSSGTYENARHQPPDPFSLRASSVDTTCCRAPTTTFEGGVLNPFLMGGRLGNSIFEMMTINMLARRYDLRAVYARASELCALGIQLWSGSQVMSGPEVRAPPAQQQALVQDLLSAEPPPALPGVLVLDDYFVFQWMAVRIREYFRDAQHAPCLRAANPWRERVDANKDTFVHVRLGDLENYHERDMSAYLAAIGEPEGAVYIASDSPQHHTVLGIAAAFPQRSCVIGGTCGGNMTLIEIMQFGASCAHLVISDGSFSWTIGALSSRYASVKIVQRDIQWAGNITMPDWIPVR